MLMIRKGIQRDAETIAAFQMAMAMETESVILDRQKVLAGVKHVLENPSLGYYLVAESNQAVAGCLMALYEWSDWRNGWVLWIHSVYVAPDHRRLGIFQAMYETIRAQVASERDLYGIRLYVDGRNHRAMEVYRRCGMDDSHYALFEWMKDEESGLAEI